MNPQLFRWIGLGLALVAALLSLSLLGLHARGTSDLGLLAGICGEDGASCEKVISSRWGYFPPAEAAPADPEAAETDAPVAAPEGSIPVAALGLFYALVLAVYFGVVGQPTWPVRRLHTVMVVVNLLGVLGSLFYIAIMFFAIGATCVLCLAVHLCNFLILPVLWQSRPEEPTFSDGEGLTRPVLPHPEPRLAIAALLLLVGLSTAGWYRYRATYAESQVSQVTALEEQLAQLQQEFETPGEDADLRLEIEALQLELERYEQLSELAEDVERLDALHLSQDQLDLGLRPDDPRIARGPGLGMQLVIFSDVECPNCGKFDELLRAEILPLFNGHLEVIHKHFPLSKNPNALPAAKALEAARLQGNDKFWAMHEILRARRGDLGAIDYAAVAAQVGLDVPRFMADREKAIITQRIGRDIQALQAAYDTLGTDPKQRGIPAAFLNGRPVNRIIRSNPGWWKIKADVLRRARANNDQGW